VWYILSPHRSRRTPTNNPPRQRRLAHVRLEPLPAKHPTHRRRLPRRRLPPAPAGPPAREAAAAVPVRRRRQADDGRGGREREGGQEHAGVSGDGLGEGLFGLGGVGGGWGV